MTFFFPINFLIWGTATVSGGEIGRFLFSPKKIWNSQKCYALFVCSLSVGILEFLIMNFFTLFMIRVMGKISAFL